MRRVPVAQLQTGDRVAKDVYADPAGLPLLKAGIRISDSYRESLKRADVPAVWVDDGLSKGIEPLEVLSEQTKRRATTAIRDAFRDGPYDTEEREGPARQDRTRDDRRRGPAHRRGRPER